MIFTLNAPTMDSNLGLQIARSVHLATQAHVVSCIYVLYKMHLRVSTSTNFYDALIFVGTYFKGNISTFST